MKILVVDDESTSRLITETAVRMLGHECCVVNDGARAWDSVLSDRPDVVISDWAMPELSGIQLCRNIRANPSSGYVYFIMVSGQGTVDNIVEGMSAGVDDYLIKPLNPDELRARLISATRLTSLHRQLDEQTAEMTRLNLELTTIARVDPLTDVGNRRGLQEDLELLEARVTRYGHRYCMALIDVDHFKSYNDSYGHQAGDEVLRAISKAEGPGTQWGRPLSIRRRRVPVHPPRAVPTGCRDRSRAHESGRGTPRHPARCQSSRHSEHQHRCRGHGLPRPVGH